MKKASPDCQFVIELLLRMLCALVALYPASHARRRTIVIRSAASTLWVSLLSFCNKLKISMRILFRFWSSISLDELTEWTTAKSTPQSEQNTNRKSLSFSWRLQFRSLSWLLRTFGPSPIAISYSCQIVLHPLAAALPPLHRTKPRSRAPEVKCNQVKLAEEARSPRKRKSIKSALSYSNCIAIGNNTGTVVAVLHGGISLYLCFHPPTQRARSVYWTGDQECFFGFDWVPVAVK